MLIFIYVYKQRVLARALMQSEKKMKWRREKTRLTAAAREIEVEQAKEARTSKMIVIRMCMLYCLQLARGISTPSIELN